MFLHTFIPHPILAHLGPFTIHWYGLFLSLGALAGFFVFRWLGKKHGLKSSDLETLFFLTLIAGIVGARLYHVTNEWGYYAAHPGDIAKIWNGGLAIHGALIAGIIVFILFSRRKKLSFWLLADCAVPAIAIGQAIGRWGNYFNQELFGKPTDLPWGIPIETLNRPIEYLNAPHFHPTFLYESLGSLLVFAILIVLHVSVFRRGQGENLRNVRSVGTVALLYLMLESLVRAGTESIRIDRVPHVFGIRLPLLVSIAIALAAAGIMLRRLARKRKT